jgi:hypothetical protein
VTEHKVMQKSVDDIKARAEEMVQSEEGEEEWLREVLNLVLAVYKKRKIE